MASNITIAPPSHDTTELQFILASKNRIFSDEIPISDAKCNLLATASTYGIVIVGCSTPELRICMLKNLTSQTNTDENRTIPLKVIPMSSQPYQLSINCDQSLLAVDVDINGIPHIQVYAVASFLTNNIHKLAEFRVSQMNSRSSQILWNPVLSNMVSVCAENGGMTVYSLKQQGFEFHSLETNEKAQCACWSPKGKQIVVGFANGKLVQYKPDLKPARVIECPPNTIEGGPFDIIALQWLSTYQFGAVFLSHSQDATPALHIVNAPKAGPPNYINYDDICYSQSGPRKAQVFIIHLIQWNLLLVASANSVEVGVLGTSESGEAPTWIQSTMAEFRAELPLYKNKEIFPIGFVLETGITEGIVVDEVKHKIMPMIHILATNGTLVSFNFMNLSANYVDICSPPRPIDNSVIGQFQSINISKSLPAAPELATSAPVTSTPAPVSKPKPFFGEAPSAGLFGNASKPFGVQAQPLSQPQPSLSFGEPAGQPFANLVKPMEAPKQQGISFGMNLTAGDAKPKPATVTAQQEIPKAIITVNPTFTPVPQQPKTVEAPKTVTKENQESSKADADENRKIFNRLIKDELGSFEKELRELLASSRNRIKVDVGIEDESANILRTTDELMELKNEATETVDSLRFEIQTLKLELNEMFAMQYEAKTKCDLYQNEKNQFVQDNQVTDKTSRRQLDKLKKLLSQNEMQLHTIVQLMDSQWSAYLETINKNKKNKMRIPNLEGLYQTLSKQQEIIYMQQEKISTIKRKLGIRDELKKQKSQEMNKTIESLTDSLISLSMADQVKAETDKLTMDKVSIIRNLLKNRPTAVIKPSRLERSDINSTVILEKRYQAMKQKVKEESTQKNTVVTKPKASVPTKERIIVKAPTVPIKSVEPPSFFHNQQPTIAKPVIPDTPVAISASFSIQIPNKPVENPLKTIQIQPRVAEKVKDKTEEKPSKTENVTFTFKLPEKKLPEKESTPNKTQPVGIFASSGESKNENKTNEPPKASFSFGTSPFGTPGDGKINFASSTGATSLFGSTNALSFGTSNKASPFAALTSTSASTSPSASVVTITPVDFTNKPVEPVATAPVFKIPVSNAVSNTIVTSADSISVSATKPKETTTFTGFADLNKQLTITNAPSTTTNVSSEPKPFDLSQTIKPAPLSFGAPQTSVPQISVAPGSTLLSNPAATTTSSSFSIGNLSFDGSTSAQPKSIETTPVITAPTQTSKIGTDIPVTSTAPIFASPVSTSSTLPNFGGILTTKSDHVQEKQVTFSVAPTNPLAVSSSFSAPAAQVSSTTSVNFGSINICGPTATTKPQTTTPSNVFSNSAIFGSPKQESTSLFGSATSNAQPFGSPTPTVSTAPQSIFATNSFTSPTVTSPQSIFGTELAKPDQSVFGATQTQPATTSSPFSGFAGATSPFAQQNQTNTGSLFETQGSIFGSTSTPATASSTFGSSFGAAAQQAASGGSLFGGASAFGSSVGASSSIFGGSTSNTFGANSGGSIFGGASQTPSNQTGSIFGGSAVFGQQAQTGGFGSSLTGGFAKPSFGASAPVFGGAPSFGSPPKPGFGLFAQAAQVSASPQQGNQLFEQLGATNNSGPTSFGNLAQTSPVQNPNTGPGFSGSSFSSWR